jgi:hypothetical protein
MPDLNHDNDLDKLTLGFVTVMSAIMLFSMGANLHERDYLALATSGVLVASLLGLAALIINFRWRELEDRARVPEVPSLDELRPLMEDLKPVIEEAIEHNRNQEMLREIIEDTGSALINADRTPEIEVAPVAPVDTTKKGNGTTLDGIKKRAEKKAEVAETTTTTTTQPGQTALPAND